MNKKTFKNPLSAWTGQDVKWRYGYMKYDTGEVGVHEFYLVNGKVESWTIDPLFVASSRKELFEVLEMIKKDLSKQKRAFLSTKQEE